MSLTYKYTTQAEMEGLFSTVGVADRLDDNDNGAIAAPETTYLDQIITYATNRLNQYLLQYHTDEDMSTNDWCREKATVIACYLLSRRRGNAAQFEAEYAEILAYLKGYPNYVGQIPFLPLRHEKGPALSNLVIDDRRMNKIRVVRPGIGDDEGMADYDNFIHRFPNG
jgi:hypothetical protein